MQSPATVDHRPHTSIARVVGNAALTIIILNVAGRVFNSSWNIATGYLQSRRDWKAKQVVH
jgi:hypothetical protein